jgi:Transposase and inactivated derivatives
MPNTYTQLYIHVVFTVKNRECVISKSWKNDLYKYITGIVQNNGHKMLAINGSNDHIHLFFGVNPNQSLSDLMKDIKANSSKWINDNRLVLGRFSWQTGYGAFSYSHSQLDNVIQYINGQEGHHKKRSFKEEYLEMLNKFDVKFEDEYLFDFSEK